MYKFPFELRKSLDGKLCMIVFIHSIVIALMFLLTMLVGWLLKGTHEVVWKGYPIPPITRMIDALFPVSGISIIQMTLALFVTCLFLGWRGIHNKGVNGRDIKNTMLFVVVSLGFITLWIFVVFLGQLAPFIQLSIVSNIESGGDVKIVTIMIGWFAVTIYFIMLWVLFRLKTISKRSGQPFELEVNERDGKSIMDNP